MYFLKVLRIMRWISSSRGVRSSKCLRIAFGVVVSPRAQQNSSKSIGYIGTISSSEGITIPSTLSRMEIREPVSM